MMAGSMGKRGKCEYTYTFFEGVILLLIELKYDLINFNHHDYSDIVAQVMAEADGILFPFHYPLILGCSVYNASKDMDRAPVQVILTDSLYWDFFYFDFSAMEVYRGETNRTFRYRGEEQIQFLLVPASETAEEFLWYLKLGNHPAMEGGLLNE